MIRSANRPIGGKSKRGKPPASAIAKDTTDRRTDYVQSNEASSKSAGKSPQSVNSARRSVAAAQLSASSLAPCYADTGTIPVRVSIPTYM